MTYQSVLNALGDPTRRQVYEALISSPRSVGELASDFPVSRPAVSQHLKVLAECGLVHAEKRGTRRIYFSDRKGLANLRTYIDTLWDDVLQAFAAEVKKQEGNRND